MRRPGVVLAFLLTAAAARAQLGPGEGLEAWRVQGDVTGQLEWYSVDGDRSQSPYRFTGWEPFAQVNLFAERPLGDYRRLRVQLLSLVNDNPYRSRNDGVVVERAALIYEHGTSAWPFRLELGDHYAYLTQRTVQRPLKGAQVDLQAPFAGGARQSFLAFSGVYKDSWRDLEDDTDWTTGVSWLVEDRRWGRFSANFLDNRREASIFGPERDQQVLSASGQVLVAGRLVSLEGEVAHLWQRDTVAGVEGPRREDDGYFFQAQNGRRHPFLFKLRFEEYGIDYRPAGAPIVTGRRSGEAHAGWRFSSGVELRGRLQHYRDGFDLANPFDNTTAGVSLRGPLLGRRVPGLLGTVDFFVEDNETRDLRIDSRVWTFHGDVSKSFHDHWTPRLRFFFQGADDHTLPDLDQDIAEVSLGVDHALTFAGFTGFVGPALLFRTIAEGVDESDDVYPTVALNLTRGPHSLRQDLGLRRLDRKSRLGIDVDTFQYHLLYRYLLVSDELGFELDSIARNPDPTADTDSWRVALSWTHRFDARRRRGPSAPAPGPGPAPLLGAGSGPLDMAELVPGTPMRAIEARLGQAGAGSGQTLGRLTTYITTVLPEISERQTLLLIAGDGVLERAGLVIEADETGRTSALLDTFATVRQTLIDRYGPPDNVFEEGGPGQEAGDDDPRGAVSRGSLVRILEWRRSGHVLRLGIPRRLDGRVTIELQAAAGFPPVTDTRWSIVDAPR